MTGIGMNKAAAEKAIPLIPLCDSGRIKNEIVNQPLIIKSTNRHQAGNNDNDKRKGKFHGYLFNFPNIEILLMMVLFIFNNCAGPVNLFCKYQSHQLMRKRERR